MQIQSYTSTLSNRNKFNQYKNRNNYATPILKKDEVSFGFKPMNALTDGLAHGMGKLGNVKSVQKLVDFLKDRNYQQHLAAFVGVVLSSFYMVDTAKSKKIEKDQKLPLITNQAVVCALSTAGAYTLDNYLDKHLGEFTEKFNIANISDPKTQKMFVKLKENPEYVEVIKQKLAKTPGTKEAIDILKNEFKLDIEELKNLAKEFQDDKTIQKVINKITELSESATKTTEAKSIFFDELKNSRTLKNLFEKQSIENAKTIDLNKISDANVKKIIAKIAEEPKNLEKTLIIQTLKEAFPILDKMFEFNNGIEKKLSKLVKEGKADEVAQKVLAEIKKLPKKITGADGKTIDRADKAKEIFMKEMKNSKVLSNIFKKQSLSNGLKLVSNNDTNLSTLMNGFKIAKSLMIFAMIYRFISPVFATPIANKISDKLEITKKKAA